MLPCSGRLVAASVGSACAQSHRYRRGSVMLSGHRRVRCLQHISPSRASVMLSGHRRASSGSSSPRAGPASCSHQHRRASSGSPPIASAPAPSACLYIRPVAASVMPAYTRTSSTRAASANSARTRTSQTSAPLTITPKLPGQPVDLERAYPSTVVSSSWCSSRCGVGGARNRRASLGQSQCSDDLWFVAKIRVRPRIRH